MKNSLFLLFFLPFFVSCNRDVQLVQANHTIDSLVIDHSPVYVFFDEKGNDTLAEVNRKNTISSTNWVFHIDKRLSLKKAIPEIIKLLEKRNEKGMHSNPDAKNYYSYMNATSKSLAFMPFSSTNYAFDSYFSTFYVKEHVDYHSHFQTFYVNYKKNNIITVDRNEVDKSELLSFLKEYTAFSSQGKPVLIYLNFDENLYFQNYLESFIELQPLINDNFTIAPTHFIYDEKKLPECNCVL